MKIEHIAMYVNDLVSAKGFFEQYLGAVSNNLYHNEKAGFRSYFLTFGDGARLEIMNQPNMDDAVKSRQRTGFIHIAFSVGSKEKVDLLTEQMRKDKYCLIRKNRAFLALCRVILSEIKLFCL